MEVDDPLTICQDLYIAAYAVPARTERLVDAATTPARERAPSEFSIRNYTTIPKEEPLPTEFSERTYNRLNTTTTTSNSSGLYVRQSGSRHTVRAGETVAGLAELYGYTEKRFRELNAISNKFDVTPGSVVLSTDCACDRINYDDPGNYGYKETDGKYDPNGFYNKTYSGTSSTIPDDYETGANTYVQPDNSQTTATANTGTVMTSVELSMVDEINLLRANPRDYARYVQAYVADQKANNGFPIDDNVVNELLQELKRSPALSNLQPLPCIYTAAQKHGQDILKMGSIEHQGSDGLWPWDRIKNACPYAIKDGNENLVGGPESVRASVIILLIDEGIPDRGHRKTLMNPKWKYVACYKIGTVGGMPNSWVQKFGY